MAQSTAKKVSVLFIANFINFLISFLIVPFLSRECTYQEYGTYSQVLLFSAFFLVIFNFGISTISNVVLAEHEENESLVFNTATIILTLASVAGILLIVLAGNSWNFIFNNEVFYKNLVYFFPTLFFQSISSYFLNTLLFYNRVKAIAVIVVSTNVLKLGMMLYSLYVLHSLAAIFISISLFTVLQCVLLYYVLPEEVRKITFKYDGQIAKQLFTPALPIMFTGLLGSGILYANGLFISNMLSVKDYAIYRNGAIEFPLVSVITASILAVTMPAFAKFKVKGEIEPMLLMRKKANVVSAAMIFPICVFLFFFSKEFIVLYLSDKYIESSLLFSVFNLTLLLRFTNYQDLLVVYKKTNYIFIANVVSFLISLALNFFLIKNLGLMGAVIAYLFSVLSLAVLLTLITCKIAKIKLADFHDWRKLIIILVISFGTGLLCYAGYQYIGGMMALCLAACLYFAVIFISFLKFNLVDKIYLLQYATRVPGLTKILNYAKTKNLD